MGNETRHSMIEENQTGSKYPKSDKKFNMTYLLASGEMALSGALGNKKQLLINTSVIPSKQNILIEFYWSHESNLF